MQIVLTDTDIAAMPAELKRALWDYLAAVKPAIAGRMTQRGDFRHAEIATAAGAGPAVLVLDRRQAIDLARELSFHKHGASLRKIMERLAYRAEADAPTPERLMRALKLKDKRKLQGHMNAIARAVERLTGDAEARLFVQRRDGGAYALHPASRQALAEVLTELARSGEHEEALWE